jgi:hypothetical protein
VRYHQRTHRPQVLNTATALGPVSPTMTLPVLWIRILLGQRLFILVGIFFPDPDPILNPTFMTLVTVVFDRKKFP